MPISLYVARHELESFVVTATMGALRFLGRISNSVDERMCLVVSIPFRIGMSMSIKIRSNGRHFNISRALTPLLTSSICSIAADMCRFSILDSIWRLMALSSTSSTCSLGEWTVCGGLLNRRLKDLDGEGSDNDSEGKTGSWWCGVVGGEGSDVDSALGGFSL